MTARKFRDALARLGLNQVEAAKVLKANPRTVRRWALGERSIPTPTAILMELLLSGKITVKDIESMHG